MVSALDSIPGIGEKTTKALLNEFKSLKGIKEASFEDLKKLVGSAKAKTIKDYFLKEDI